VAVKVLLADPQSDDGLRFVREAEDLRSIAHPNVVTCFDSGPGFMAMELVEGLLLHRATQRESPFRFLCIDDPVQAMDPSKVEGRARVLEGVAASHQVIVFTHDTRLYDAVLRVGIQAEVIEVTRQARSVVEMRRAYDPVERIRMDARALALTTDLPVQVGRRVVPSFCRRALEIAFVDA
jgi:hypothetical protein